MTELPHFPGLVTSVIAVALLHIHKQNLNVISINVLTRAESGALGAPAVPLQTWGSCSTANPSLSHITHPPSGSFFGNLTKASATSG